MGKRLLGASDPIPRLSLTVIPAQAGIQWRQFPVFPIEQKLTAFRDKPSQSHWVPACAGMTNRRLFVSV